MTPVKASRPLFVSTLLALPVSLYLALVCMLMAAEAFSPAFFILLAAGFFCLLLGLSRRFGDSAPFRLSGEDAGFSPRAFFFAFFLCLAMMLLFLWAFLPGGVSSDTLYQWRQIHGEQPMTDWHPALHTLFLLLLTRICDHPTFCILVQLLLYALAVGSVYAVLFRFAVPRGLRLAALFLLCCSPAACSLMQFLWKDCLFAACMVALIASLLGLRLSSGAWLASRTRRIGLAVMLCLCAILRHNGPALVLPLFVWLFVSWPKQSLRILRICLVSILLFCLIKVPLYRAFDVSPRESGLDEIAGVPLTLLANVYAQRPEALDEDIVAFLEDVAPYEVFQEHNTVGDWNDIKWAVGKIYTVRPYSLREVASFAIRAWRAAPDLAAEALAYLWQMPMWVVCDAYWRMTPYAWGDYPLPIASSAFLCRALGWVCRTSARPVFAWLFWLPGFWMALLLCCCVIFAPYRKPSALLMPAGLIAYHLATSLFLSSSTDFRFYLGFVLCVPCALIGLLCKTLEETP